MSKNKLIKAQKEYIKLLEESLSKHSGFMVTRPYIKLDSQKDVDRGQELRESIKKYQ